MWATQLDICNIYTSKFCTKPRIARKEREREREIAAQQKGTRDVEETEKTESNTHLANIMWLFIYIVRFGEKVAKRKCVL